MEVCYISKTLCTLDSLGIEHRVGKQILSFFTVVPCILILSNSFIYQLMHNRVALKEY